MIRPNGKDVEGVDDGALNCGSALPTRMRFRHRLHGKVAGVSRGWRLARSQPGALATDKPRIDDLPCPGDQLASGPPIASTRSRCRQAARSEFGVDIRDRLTSTRSPVKTTVGPFVPVAGATTTRSAVAWLRRRGEGW